MTRPYFPHIIKLRNYIQIPQFSLSSTLLVVILRRSPKRYPQRISDLVGFPSGGSSACGDEGQTNKTLAFCLKGISTLLERKMRSRRRPLVPTLTYLSRTKICASGKICSVAPLPTKGLPFAGSLNTQAACYRVSSSCTLYEVFGNFAWRNAPPRKRVTQSEKALALRDREVPPAGGSRRGARLRGNGDRGTCLTEGVSFTSILVSLFSPPKKHTINLEGI